MTDNFNSYIESPSADFWRALCLREGVLRHFDKGEDFFTEGQVARYFGYIKSGTLKYVAYGEDGTEHVIGLEFAGEFVTDFPFSFRGQKARSSVVAETPCEIYCLSTVALGESMQTRFCRDCHCRKSHQGACGGGQDSFFHAMISSSDFIVAMTQMF